MLIARVVGEVVATRKDEKLVGTKLLVVRQVSPSGKDESTYLVAVDTAGNESAAATPIDVPHFLDITNDAWELAMGNPSIV